MTPTNAHLACRCGQWCAKQPTEPVAVPVLCHWIVVLASYRVSEFDVCFCCRGCVRIVYVHCVSPLEMKSAVAFAVVYLTAFVCNQLRERAQCQQALPSACYTCTNATTPVLMQDHADVLKALLPSLLLQAFTNLIDQCCRSIDHGSNAVVPPFNVHGQVF